MYSSATTPVENSLLVRRKTSSEHDKYLDGLSEAMQECSRVLKLDGMLVFTFHHRLAAAWQALASALQSGKFIVTSVCPVRAEGVSGFHSYDGTPKWDADMCCRLRLKPTKAFGGKADPSLARITKYEARWTKRLVGAELPWNQADKASFAYSLALKEMVNLDMSEIDSRKLFDEVTALYIQAGVSGSIPRRGVSA